MAYSLKKVAETTIPIGTIVAYYGTNPPSGWLICDGRSCAGTELQRQLGITNVPDLRGRFIRMVGGNAAAMAVPQGDAIRNIKGSHNMGGEHPSVGNSADGAFYHSGSGQLGSGSSDWDNQRLYFDASRVVPTANENRPVNMAFNYIIKSNYQ